VKAEMEKTKMNSTIAYCQAKIVVLGGVAEMICATHIKGPTAVMETTVSRINPSYDLDE